MHFRCVLEVTRFLVREELIQVVGVDLVDLLQRLRVPVGVVVNE